MRRDTIKTLSGLLIIVLIVVGTFLIGNARHQSQVRHAADVKRQQQAADQKAKDEAAQKQQANNSQPKPAAGGSAQNGISTPSASGNIPDTGAGEDLMLVPIAIIGGMSFMLYRSRRAVRVAIRSR